MNLSELIKARKAAEGVGWDEMALRAQRAGYEKFSKSQLSRAANEPLLAFPTKNLGAFCVALRVPLLEVMCACAHSLYGDRFRFTPGLDGKSVIFEQIPGVFEDGEPDGRLIIWEISRHDVAQPVHA